MLTDIAILSARREFKGATKPRKLWDKRGLYLLLTVAGTALWRFKFVFGGVEKLIALGSYPDTSLKLAREKRDAARVQVAGGQNPSIERQKAKRNVANTFAEVAEEYVSKQVKKLAPRTVSKARSHLRMWVNPHLGNKPIRSIEAPDLLWVIRRIEVTGKIETAHKVKELCGRVFLYGVATSRCAHNIAARAGTPRR
jgi:hypothetical protein